MQNQNKKILSKLPAKRKLAGKRAHVAAYKKMLKYSTIQPLLNFLSINHPCPSKAKVQLFFEVALGNRVSDSVMLVTCGETRLCYIIEFKTCISQATNMFNEVRQSQRSQGLCQLLDAVKFIEKSAPRGKQVWRLLPCLVFKSQGTLRTIHSETPPFSVNQIHSSGEKLVSFFYSREDVKTREQLHKMSKVPKVAKKYSILGTTSSKCSLYKQRSHGRNKEKRLQLQKKRDGAQSRKNKEKPAQKRTWWHGPKPHCHDQWHS